MLTLFENIDL